MWPWTSLFSPLRLSPQAFQSPEQPPRSVCWVNEWTCYLWITSIMYLPGFSLHTHMCIPHPVSLLSTGEDKRIPAMITGGDAPQEHPCPCQRFLTAAGPEAKHFHDEQSTPHSDSILRFWLREVSHPPTLAWPIARPGRGWGQGLRCPFVSGSVFQSLPQPPCSPPRESKNLRVEENCSSY